MHLCACAHAVPELTYSERSFCVCMHMLMYSIGNLGQFDIQVVL